MKKCQSSYDGFLFSYMCSREEGHIGLHIWSEPFTTVRFRWREWRGCWRQNQGMPCPDNHDKPVRVGI